MTLARERAIATAYLLSGDEDTREAVVAAQDMGVRITLLGIPPRRQRFNQAATLTREADEHVVLEEEFWSPHFSRKSIAEVPEVPEDSTATEVARERGRAFGAEWASRATSDELLELLGRAPQLPRELDAQLIRDAEKSLGNLREREDLRKELRRGFWEALEATRGS